MRGSKLKESGKLKVQKRNSGVYGCCLLPLFSHIHFIAFSQGRLSEGVEERHNIAALDNFAVPAWAVDQRINWWNCVCPQKDPAMLISRQLTINKRQIKTDIKFYKRPKTKHKVPQITHLALHSENKRHRTCRPGDIQAETQHHLPNLRTRAIKCDPQYRILSRRACLFNIYRLKLRASRFITASTPFLWTSPRDDPPHHEPTPQTQCPRTHQDPTHQSLKFTHLETHQNLRWNPQLTRS